MHFAATIERAEKQIILAKHGRRLLNLLDDTPMVPGDARPQFEHAAQARQVLNDAEEDLREWEPRLEPVQMQSQGMGTNLMPADSQVAERGIAGERGVPGSTEGIQSPTEKVGEGSHLHGAIAPSETTGSEIGTTRSTAGTAV